MKLAPIAIIALIVAALLASGCTGSGKVVEGRLLLHTDNVTWYEYRENHSGVADKYGAYDTVYHKRQIDNSTYNGTIAPHLRMTDRYGGSHDVTYISDNYFDPTGSILLYCHTERLENGTAVMSGDDYILNHSITLWPDTYDILCLVWMNNFTAIGKERLTINGSVYECDRYREENPQAQTILIWVDPDIPVPVKFSEENDDWSCELVGWG